MRVVVTGAAGTLGSAVVTRLADEGYDTVGVDMVPHHRLVDHRADLTEPWAARHVVEGADAVLHLGGLGTPDAAWGRNGFLAERYMGNANVTSGWNVFAAAREAGVGVVVWASSETVLGAPFAYGQALPELPLSDCSERRPGTAYSMSKALLEDCARHLGLAGSTTFIGLRFSIVMTDAAYERLVPETERNPLTGLWNLWSYTDLEDAVEACVRGLRVRAVPCAQAVIIAAPDTLSTLPTRELLDRFAPDARLREEPSGRSALLCSDAAADLLGWAPSRSWTGR